MKNNNYNILGFLLLVMMTFMVTIGGAMPYLQDDKKGKAQQQKSAVTAQPVLDNEDSIPDSLLHPRWKIQRTVPVTYDDLDQG